MQGLSSTDFARLEPGPRRKWVTLFVSALVGLQALPALSLIQPFLGLLTLPLLVVMVVHWALPAFLVPVRGALHAGPDGVRWNDRLLARRNRIRAGVVVPRGDHVEVRLSRRFPFAPLRFVAPSEAGARALLRELGLDASQTALTLKFGSLLRGSSALAILWQTSIFALPLALAIALVLALISDSAGGIVGAGLLALVSIAWLMGNVAPSIIQIGADGLLIDWLWRRRFITYDAIRDIRMYVGNTGAGLIVVLRSGEEVCLPRMGAFSTSLDRGELDLVVRRVQEAVEHQRQARADRGVVLPERGGRDAAAWIADLRSVGTGARSDHRTAPVETDRLLRIAEDPGAPAATRAAAAVALGAVADERTRARLRIAAESSAQPALKTAMALAAEEEAAEEELTAALDRVDSVRPILR